MQYEVVFHGFVTSEKKNLHSVAHKYNLRLHSPTCSRTWYLQSDIPFEKIDYSELSFFLQKSSMVYRKNMEVIRKSSRSEHSLVSNHTLLTWKYSEHIASPWPKNA